MRDMRLGGAVVQFSSVCSVHTIRVFKCSQAPWIPSLPDQFLISSSLSFPFNSCHSLFCLNKGKKYTLKKEASSKLTQTQSSLAMNWVLHHFLSSGGGVTSRFQARLLGHMRGVLFVVLTCQSMPWQPVIYCDRPSLVEQRVFFSSSSSSSSVLRLLLESI